MGWRIGRIVIALVGVLVILVGGLTLLLQTGPVSRRVKELVVPRASAALGREVTVREARLRIFPRPRVILDGASVAGRPGEPPLAQLDSLDVAVEAWPLVRSLGKDVRVAGIRLVRPVVNLVRAEDGTWNYQGLGEGGGQSPPPGAGQGESRSNVVVDHFALVDGSIRLLDRIRGGEAAVAVTKIDLSADHVGPGQPLDAKLSAALAGEQKNFSGEIHASRLPAAATELGPGKYPELQGSLSLKGLDLARVRAFLPPKVTGIMTGGRVDADAKLSTESGRYRVDGAGKLSQVRLRGEPAQGSFELHAVADPASGAAHASIDKLALKGPGVDLGGNATVQLAPPPAGAKPGTPTPTKVRFAIAGPLLDLGQVMGLLPQDQAQSKQEKPFQLTAEQRKSLQALDVQGTIDIEKVVKGALLASGFKAKAVLDQGVFVLQDAQAGFFGGRVDAAGTRLDLSPAQPAWNLKAKLDAIDLGQALSAFAGSAPVVGKLTGALALDGAGVDWPTLKKELTGNGTVSLKQGAITTTDLGDKVLGAVAQGLRAAGKGSAAEKVGGAGGGKTELRDLAAQFTVKDGAMALSKPLSFMAPFGAVNLGGKIGLGGELALQGDAKVSKDVLERAVGGTGLPLPANLTVPLGLGGSLMQPSVNVNAQQAVTGLAAGAAKQKVQELQQGAQDRAKREARRGLGDVLRRFGK